MSGSDPANTAKGWVEPTRLLPLKWGRYVDRYLAGLVLIITGTLALQASNVYAPQFFIQGIAALAVGWSIMPARGWRRILGAAFGVGQGVVLLTGPQSTWSLAIPFALWLCVRHRPLRTYITALFPLVAGIAVAQFFEEYDGMPVALAITMTVVVASAWLARLIAKQGRPREDLPNSQQNRVP